jgi:predicted Zn-dependent protease
MKLSARFLILIFLIFPVHPSDHILMDDETEKFITDIVDKIKEALKYKGDINVYISSSQVLNAAATQSGDIIINVGAILRCTNVSELIAIIAHEVGHIAGVHISSYIALQPDFVKAGLITTLIGATVAAFARNPTPLVAGIVGGQSMSQGMSLEKLRQKENIADSKALQAVKILKWPVLRGFVSLHEKLNSDTMYNQYSQTHPPEADRINKFRKAYAEEKNKSFPEANIIFLNTLQKRFESIQIKLQALTCDLQTGLSLYSKPKTNSEKFAKAIVLFRDRGLKESILVIDDLCKNMDEDVDPAYYTEIKCMSLISIKQCKEAADIAWNILKNDKTTRIHRDLTIIYGNSVAEGNLRGPHLKQAIKLLKKLTMIYKDEISAVYLLGKLYEMNKQIDYSSLYAAEFAMRIGDTKMAEHHAKKAAKSNNSMIKHRAEDTLLACKNESQEK